MAPPRRSLLEEFDLDLDAPLPVAPEEDYLTRRQRPGLEDFDLEAPAPPPEVAALARSAPQDELRSAQQESNLLRFLSRQGQGLDESARIIAGVPGRMQVDLDAADRPVQQVQQRQAEAYKLAQAEAARTKEAEAKAEKDRLEAKRDKQREEDIARSTAEREKDRKSRERAAGIASGNRAAVQEFEQTAKLRGELANHPITKSYNEAAIALDKVESAASDPSAAGDLALIFGLMKTLDPGSTVREGEFANAQNAGGIPERIWAKYNQIKNGERLTPEQRADFVSVARQQFNAHRTRYEALASGISGVASSYGLRPERVVLPGTGSPTAAPAAGGVVRVRRKSDGAVKALPADKAARYLSDPNFERVE